jgi:hypothetical protein
MSIVLLVIDAHTLSVEGLMQADALAESDHAAHDDILSFAVSARPEFRRVA